MKVITFCLLLSSYCVNSHPDIIVNIQNLTASITISPKNGDLYLKRADLYRQHQNWPAALKDIASAESYGEAMNVISFYKAQLFRDKKEIIKAKGLYLKTLKLSENDTAVKPIVSRAHINLAEIYQNNQNWLPAAEHFLAAIKNNHNVDSGVYLACAKAYMQSGVDYSEKALKILDSGIKHNPGIISYYQLAIKIEKQRKNYQAAINRTLQLINKYPKLESHKRHSLYELNQLFT